MTSKSQAIISLTGIFLLGIALGFVLDSFVLHHDDQKPKPPNLVEIFTKELELTLEQKTKLEELLNNLKKDHEAIRSETHTRFGSVRDEFDRQFMQILTPAQQEKFKKMKEEFEKRDHHR
jgi:Spy/CpxP family protein refolding chaperone